MEILFGKGEVIDSGSGTTVVRYHDLLHGPVVKKIFDLAGSESLTIHGLKDYQKLTNHLAHEFAKARLDLVSRRLAVNGLDLGFTWRVNPILRVGESHKKLYSVSKLIAGVSLGDLFSDSTVIPSELSVLNSPEVKTFLREELVRVNQLIQFDHPYLHLNLLALNVLAERQSEMDFGLVITNLREYVSPHSHPLGLFRKKSTLG